MRKPAGDGGFFRAEGMRELCLVWIDNDIRLRQFGLASFPT